VNLLLDMNLTVRWVRYLAAAGYEAIHWSDVGEPTASDSEICEYARQRGFIVITNDLDFPQILSQTRHAAPSLVLLRGYPLTPEIRGIELLRALRLCEAELERGAILSLSLSGKPRARLLPIE
jgi:predicted nuclease of predicted toxin-antitoxin system